MDAEKLVKAVTRAIANAPMVAPGMAAFEPCARAALAAIEAEGYVIAPKQQGINKEIITVYDVPLAHDWGAPRRP